MGGRLILLAALAALALGAAPAASATTWCGGGETLTDVMPDATGGLQFHVAYAVPSDGADRFAAISSAIATDLEAVDAWWRSQDPTRTPRFDFGAFPGCSGFGALDLTFLRLPHDSAYYADFATRFARLVADVRALPHDPRKKYLTYYDGPVDATACGQSSGNVGGGSDSFVYLGTPGRGCGTVGDGIVGYRAATAAHELSHAMGVVPTGAPHACPGDPAHICDSSTDLMYPGRSVNLDGTVLDIGRDDYYRSGGAFDLSTSVWLRRLDQPEQQLTVHVVGGGEVTGGLPGADCRADCTSTWDGGATVGLDTAAPPQLRFLGWRGDCSGRAGCSLTFDAPRTVTALFGPANVALAVAVAGRGRVTVDGTTCRRSCRTSVSAGTPLALAAAAERGWRFVRWTGACRGAKPRCTATLESASSVGAVFSRARATA